MQKYLLATAATLAMAVSSAPASAAVFLVDLTVGGGGATGTITTDDTIGALTSANVTDWSLLLDDGNTTFQLNGRGNSDLLVSGTGFTASASGLFFDFGGSGFALFQNPSPGSGINFLCFAASLCGANSNSINVATSDFNLTQSSPQRGVVQVASLAAGAVPEPATWAFMILGFGAIGGAMRRQRKPNVKVSFA